MTEPDDPDGLWADVSWAPILAARVWAELEAMYGRGALSSWPPDAQTVAAVVRRLFPVTPPAVRKREPVQG